MTGVSRLARAFRRAALPLAAYYGVTLGLPLANGAAMGGSVFVSHALVVLVVPLVLIVFACTAHQAVHALGRAADQRLPSTAGQLRTIVNSALSCGSSATTVRKRRPSGDTS